MPVTPATWSSSVGRPKNSSAATAIAAPRARDDELRHVELERPLDDQRHGAVRDRVGGELVPVRSRPGNAEEEAARPGRAGVVGEVGDLDGSPPEHVRRRERRDQLVDLHRGASLATGPAEAARLDVPRT